MLQEKPIFPPPELAGPDGLIAIGGDLSPERLLNAYASGIFPWFNEGDPLLWWSPDPRLVLVPGELHISRTMQKLLNRHAFRVTVDTHFREVMENCRDLREAEPGTWITSPMIDAYARLHDLGFAHSVEAWQEDQLAGGLYGVSLGRCFFGESMFFNVPNASKYAFITFAQKIFDHGFRFIDCQVPTTHLASLGAREVTRKTFLKMLKKALKHETLIGKWNFLNEE